MARFVFYTHANSKVRLGSYTYTYIYIYIHTPVPNLSLYTHKLECNLGLYTNTGFTIVYSSSVFCLYMLAVVTCVSVLEAPKNKSET